MLNNVYGNHAPRAVTGTLVITAAIVLLLTIPAASQDSDSKIAPLVFASEYSNNSWHVLENAANTGRGHAWANVAHFSTFTIAGTQAITLAQSNDSDSDSIATPLQANGSGSSSPYDNIIKAERYDRDLIANIPVVYIFTAPEHGIYEIAITGKENENDIALRIEMLKGTSRRIKEPAPGIAYKNINIWTNTKKIKETLIRFKIENSWITSSGLESNDIKMLKWDGSKWIQLETVRRSEDASYTYYEAKTDSLSSFAISGLKGMAVPIATQTATVDEIPINQTATAPVEAHGIQIWGYTLTAAAIIAVAAYLFTKKRQKPEE